MRDREWKKKAHLIRVLAENDFKGKFASAQLGVFWAFFRPVVQACVYVFIFSYIARATPAAKDVPYALWLLPGLIVWFAFSDGVNAGAGALTEYSYLVKNIKFDVSLLPIIRLVSSFFVHTFFILLVVVLYLLFGIPVRLTLLQIPYYYLGTFLFTLAVAKIVSSIQPFFRDLSALIELILMVGMWASPVMWDLTILPERFWPVMRLNPMYHLVTGYRESFLGTGWFWEHPLEMALFWGITLLLHLWGRRLFRQFSGHFADVI